MEIQQIPDGICTVSALKTRKSLTVENSGSEFKPFCFKYLRLIKEKSSVNSKNWQGVFLSYCPKYLGISCAKRIRLDLVFWGLPDFLKVGLSDAGFVQLPFATEIFLISRACAHARNRT